jgi:CBS domain containing-hemolysin-like protein
MGINRQESMAFYHTPEELQYIIEESQEGGMLKEEAGRVLRDLFEFGELNAEEVMVPRVRIVGIPLDASADRLREIILQARHTRYPVFELDPDHIIGVVHIKDICRLLYEKRTLTRDIIRPVPFVPETAKLDNVLESMRRAHAKMAVIMDEHGGTSGLITVEDLFSEVVGDIEEDKDHPQEIYQDELGRWHVDGTVHLDDLSEETGIALEHEDVDTVSGLVLMLLERPPHVGDVVIYQQIQFEVVKVHGHGVAECLLTLPPAAEPPAAAE